jgi:hypothetical protein
MIHSFTEALERLAAAIQPPLRIAERIAVPPAAENVVAFRAPNCAALMPVAPVYVRGVAITVRGLTLDELKEAGRLIARGDSEAKEDFIIRTATGRLDRTLSDIERQNLLDAATELSLRAHSETDALAAITRGASNG